MVTSSFCFNPVTPSPLFSHRQYLTSACRTTTSTCINSPQWWDLHGKASLRPYCPTTHLPVLHKHWNALCALNTLYIFTLMCLQACDPSNSATPHSHCIYSRSLWISPIRQNTSIPHQTASCLNHWPRVAAQAHCFLPTPSWTSLQPTCPAVRHSAVSMVCTLKHADLINPTLWETNQWQRKVKWLDTHSTTIPYNPLPILLFSFHW